MIRHRQGKPATGGFWGAAMLVLAAALWCAPVRAEPPKDPDLQRLSAQLAQLDADPALGPLGGVDP